MFLVGTEDLNLCSLEIFPEFVYTSRNLTKAIPFTTHLRHPLMNKKQMSEQDIRSKFITPAIVEGGWDLLTQIREEVTFTKGKVIVRGKLVSRGKGNGKCCPMCRTPGSMRAKQ
jgi:hypothetical protein